MQPHIWNNKERSANPFFQANSIHCCPSKSREFVLCQFCTMMLPNQHHAQPLSHAVLFNTKPITSNHQAKFKHTTKRIQITLQVVKKQTPISSWPSHRTSPGDLSHGPTRTNKHHCNHGVKAFETQPALSQHAFTQLLADMPLQTSCFLGRHK